VVGVAVTDGQATVDGTSVPYSASALVNLSTMALTFDSTATINSSFGPEFQHLLALAITDAGLAQRRPASRRPAACWGRPPAQAVSTDGYFLAAT
jgi:hypothetical protein